MWRKPPRLKNWNNFCVIYGVIRNHVIKKSWDENTKDTYENNEPQMFEDITIEEIINTPKRTPKWKSPGIKKKKNFLTFGSTTFPLRFN